MGVRQENVKKKYGPFRVHLVPLILIILAFSTLLPPLACNISNISGAVSGAEGTEFLTPRPANSEIEPNNDFGNATIIQYDLSGTTHVFDSTVGGGADPTDYWRIDTDRGAINYSGNDVIGSDYSDRITIVLSFNETNQGSNGIYMNIFDADYHQLGSTQIAQELVPVTLTFIAQVNPYVYLEIQSNPQDNNYNYILSISNETEKFNPAFTNDERFSTAQEINITKGITLSSEYLDKGYDFADFYKFNASSGQKIEISMQPSSNTNDDFDLALFWSKSVSTKFIFSEKIKQAEEILYYSPTNRTYYLRVGVKNIADPNLRNQGNYKITFTGNLPPSYNRSFSDTYFMDEDGAELILPIQDAFYDLNFGDLVFIEILDPNQEISGRWVGLEELTSFGLTNLTVHQHGDSRKDLRLKTRANKFGTEILYLRATDNLGENYTYKKLWIIIKPTNDPPILNNTKFWETGLNVWTDSNENSKNIYCVEGDQFECTVTAYEPVDPRDSLTFSDNTDLFDIEPKTGKISFGANYTHTGTNPVEITATDNGTPEMSTSRVFNFIIKKNPIHPEVKLLGPANNSVLVTLRPTLMWEQINEDFEDSILYYNLYLSTNKDLVIAQADEAFIKTIDDETIFKIPYDLDDQTVYYWCIIPNDGLRKGSCLVTYNEFEINLNEPIPSIEIVYPVNNQIITTDSVTLQWTLDFTGKDKVSYEVFFGTTFEQLSDPLVKPRDVTTKTSYLVKNLYYNKDYYWMIIPFTDRIRASMNENDTEIYMFHVSLEAPEVFLNSPANNSIITLGTKISLNWEVDYDSPNQAKSLLYLSSSPELDTTTPVEVGSLDFYISNDLETGTYYWKVVPYVGNLMGIESDTWKFSIKMLDVPEARLIEPVNTTFYVDGDIHVVILTWAVDYELEFDYKNIWFDVYLDNSTNIPGKMTRITDTEYKQTFYTVIIPIEEDKVYNWYVIPHLEIDDGVITGISNPGVATFTFGPKNIFYEIGIELETNLTQIEPGSTRIIQFYLRNRGNTKVTIDLYITSTGEGFINPVLSEKTVVLAETNNKLISLNIFVLDNIEVINYTLTIQAIARESTVVKAEETILIEILGPDLHKDEPIPEESIFEKYPFLWIIIVVIILLLSVFLYSKIKRHKMLQHQRRKLIFDYVKENPGEHFRAIQKALNLEVGVLAHHINKLEREEFVKSRQDGKYRRFYPMDAKINIRFILSEIQERILNCIKKNPGSSGSTIANNLGVDRKLVNYHVNVLEKGGFIYTEPKGKEKLCYSVQN